MNQDCPFCGSSQLRKSGVTSKANLLREYKKTFGLTFPPSILASSFAFETLVTFECVECGTVTFRPQILGDGSYYDFLSKNLAWYYSESRWEYPIALEVLEKENATRFLEIGCGDGHFLRLARRRGHEGHGSELNPDSVERLRSSGFEVITNFERDLGNGEYDSLVMFQVLEHLPDPYSVLKTMIPYIRSRGTIILTTPVTPSCCATIARPTLLMPPHHQSLPTALGFERLADRIGCVCEDIRFEPTDVSQIEFGLRKRFGFIPYFGRCSRRLAGLTLRIARAMRCDWARVGHTVLAVFRVPSR